MLKISSQANFDAILTLILSIETCSICQILRKTCRVTLPVNQLIFLKHWSKSREQGLSREFNISSDSQESHALYTKPKLRSVIFWVISQSIVLIPHRRIGISYRSNLQTSWSLKIRPIEGPETSVRNYHYKLRNTQKSVNFLYFAVKAWNHA
jgi:hypothetical protein